MKTLLAAILLLRALPVVAQGTPIAIVNPSFELSPSVPVGDPVGPWGNGAIAGWTASGSVGEWQPAASQFASLPDGQTVAWSNGGSISQDLGVPVQANATYTLSVYVGHRFGGWVANYAINLNAGTANLCSATGSNGTIPAGTFQQITLTCPAGANPAAGNLSIVLSGTGAQIDFDNVSLTIPGQPPPFVFTLNGFGSFTFPMQVPPDCSAGDCSLVWTGPNGTVTVLPGQSGSLVIHKPTGDVVVVQIGP